MAVHFCRKHIIEIKQSVKICGQGEAGGVRMKLGEDASVDDLDADAPSGCLGRWWVKSGQATFELGGFQRHGSHASRTLDPALYILSAFISGGTRSPPPS